jgi:hypothetical protein
MMNDKTFPQLITAWVGGWGFSVSTALYGATK